MKDSRPKLSNTLDPDVFVRYYYLKEELMSFCRENSISASGSKTELSKRVEHFLKTGEKAGKHEAHIKRSYSKPGYSELSPDTLIEDDFCCTQRHRAYFESVIGKEFHFSVKFQRFLKSSAGMTYEDAVNEWYRLAAEKKSNKRTETIDPQFEYNKYIRTFFKRNKGKTIQDAIKCWKYKRNQPGTNEYEDSDLTALKEYSNTI
ncbi:MAG: DUF6434 domain-containing protein [Bacillota bacterium]